MVKSEEDQLSPPSKFQCSKKNVWKIFLSLVYYASVFACCSSWTAGTTTVREVAVLLGVSEERSGQFFLWRGLGMVFGGFFFGLAVDVVAKCQDRLVRFWLRVCSCCRCAAFECLLSRVHSLHFLLAMSPFVFVVAEFTIPHVRSLTLQFFLHFCLGFVDSGQVVTSTILMSRLWKGNTLSSAMQGFAVSFSIGGLLFPLYVGLVFGWGMSPAKNLLAIHTACGAMYVIPLVLILLCETPPPRDDGENGEAKKSEGCGVSCKCLFRTLHVVNLGLCYLFFCAAESTFALVFSYAIHLGQSNSIASLLTSVYFAGSLVGRIAASLLAHIFTNVQLMAVSLAGAVIFALALQVIYSNVVWVFAATFIVAMFNAPVYMGVFLIPPGFSIELSGLDTSILVVLGSAGFFFPSLTNYLMEVYSPLWFQTSMLVYFLFALVFLGIALVCGLCYRVQRSPAKIGTEKGNEDELTEIEENDQILL